MNASIHSYVLIVTGEPSLGYMWVLTSLCFEEARLLWTEFWELYDRTQAFVLSI